MESFFEEHCARTICSMESYDIKIGCLFCDQGDQSNGREKDHELIVSMTWVIFDDILTNMIRDNLSGLVMFRTFINFSQNYSLLMQFSTDPVQTVQAVE